MRLEILRQAYGRECQSNDDHQPTGTRQGNVADNSAGISIGLIDDIPTCDELVSRITREAEVAIQGMNGMISVQGGEEAWERSRTREAKL